MACPPTHRWARHRARQLRREMTDCEQQLWACLRAKRLDGWKFRRQAPVGRYIADFVCFQARLIVELDGAHHHDQQEHDASRDAWLRSQGFEILRVWNSQWLSQREAVLGLIWAALRERSPLP
ncbi:endonuclease domain-containing protein [Roseateles sp. BYS180W]|uniref:Endonuclease domain-containing protein n=1 Tax=Roseateles rivi TaxID=3299028 RepID=A0ABW7FS07_9BURK